MNLKLKIWRQKNAHSQGKFVDYTVENISPDTSFLEMLDILNNDLIHKGEEPVVFDHDCREGICGMCSLHINGHAHGPDEDITTCQLHMRKFHDGETITIEPWRSRAFPVNQGPGRRPQRVRQDSAGRRFRLGRNRRSARREYDSDSEARCRREHGCGRVHRMRRLCGYLQERIGHAVRRSSRVVAR